LDNSLDLPSTLDNLVRLGASGFADYCAVDLITEDNQLTRTREAIRSPGGKLVCPEMKDILPVGALPEDGSPRLYTKTESGAISTIIQRSSDEAIRRIEFASLIRIPLNGRDKRIGFLVLARFQQKNKFTGSDFWLARQIAARAAFALENCLLYAQLERSIKARNEFIAILSHDLRSPLNSIMLLTQLIQRNMRSERPSSEQNRNLSAKIQNCVKKMNSLIENLLDIDGIEGGRFELKLSEKPLRHLLAEICGMFEPVAVEKKIRFSIDGGSVSGCRCRVDQERVFQALMNIVGNAMKFTSDRGEVSLTAQKRENALLLTVRDNGPGIPKADQPHIFDRYWQGGKRHKGSAGLGLSISKGIVEAHGGRIWVESSPGTGSAFFLLFPNAFSLTAALPSGAGVKIS
jgi:signal transduction histidine kinase